MNNKFSIVGLDAEGNIVMDEVTNTSASISELMVYFDSAKIKLFNGRIVSILITNLEEN